MPRLLQYLFKVGMVAALSASVWALPDQPTVVHGSATFQTNGNVLQILQNSSQAIINWNGFNINRNELVQFLQNNSQSIVLNRVTGATPSSLLGNLSANGRVYIINPNGIFIGPEAQIDTASFLASTLQTSDSDFLSGKMKLTQDPSLLAKSIVNQGKIHVSDGGFVVLAAPLVSNEGLIVAHVGQVQISGTKVATVNFDGRGLVSYELPASSTLPDGTVALSPQDTGNLLTSLFPGNVKPVGDHLEVQGGVGVVANSGTIDVSGGTKGGSVVLNSSKATVLLPTSSINADGDTGGRVQVLSSGTSVLDGTVSARGLVQGGDIELSGKNFQLKGSTDVSASKGRSGTFLIDPDTITVISGTGTLDSSLPNLNSGVANSGANTVSQASLANQQGTVVLQATGDVNFNALAGGQLSLQNGASLNVQSETGNIVFANPADAIVAHGGSLNFQAGGSATLGQLFALGGSINVQTGGALHYSTLVAQNRDGAGGSVAVNAGGDIDNALQGLGIGANSVSLTSTGGAIRVPLVSTDNLNLSALNGITANILPGSLDSSSSSPTRVGTQGTSLTAVSSSGAVSITSQNTLGLQKISGTTVDITSTTGSLLGLPNPQNQENITSLGDTHLYAPAGYIGTPGNPISVNVGGQLTANAGAAYNDVSGLIVGRTASGRLDISQSAATVLFNPASFAGSQELSQLNIFQNQLAGPQSSAESLTGGSYLGLYSSTLQFAMDPDDWRKFLSKQIIWEDESADEDASKSSSLEGRQLAYPLFAR